MAFNQLYRPCTYAKISVPLLILPCIPHLLVWFAQCHSLWWWLAVATCKQVKGGGGGLHLLLAGTLMAHQATAEQPGEPVRPAGTKQVDAGGKRKVQLNRHDARAVPAKQPEDIRNSELHHCHWLTNATTVTIVTSGLTGLPVRALLPVSAPSFLRSTPWATTCTRDGSHQAFMHLGSAVEGGEVCLQLHFPTHIGEDRLCSTPLPPWRQPALHSPQQQCPAPAELAQKHHQPAIRHKQAGSIRTGHCKAGAEVHRWLPCC